MIRFCDQNGGNTANGSNTLRPNSSALGGANGQNPPGSQTPRASGSSISQIDGSNTPNNSKNCPRVMVIFEWLLSKLFLCSAEFRKLPEF